MIGPNQVPVIGQTGGEFSWVCWMTYGESAGLSKNSRMSSAEIAM